MTACPACGASIEARAGATLVCPHCGHRAPIAPMAAGAAGDYEALLAASLAASPVEEQAVLRCARCGAETTVPATVLAERCPFCATPTVSPVRDRLRRPTAILPFGLDEAAARAAVVAWERGLWFRPARLGPAGGAWVMAAVYLPYWSFDWDVTTEYVGARGQKSDDKTSWTDVTGTVSTRLHGSTVLGSRGIDRGRGAELEPWDTEHVVGFKDEYLQGVRAECSELSLAEAGALGHRLLERRVVDDIERDIGGDEQRIERKTVRHDAAAVRLVLMPIWVTHFEHAGRRHQVLVNARSGEVLGDRPVSRAKLWAAGVAPLVLAVGGAVVGGWSGGWKAGLLGFWTVLGGLGLIALIVGSAMSARAPARQRELYVARRGPGSTTLQVDPAAMWSGALQGDALGRATLVQLAGFALVFVSLMPAAVLFMFPERMPIIMMHAFSLFATAAFVYALVRAARDRRALLGLDEP